MVGGQAVINGVMMRVPGFYSTAVRNPKNEIIFNRQTHRGLQNLKRHERCKLDHRKRS